MAKIARINILALAFVFAFVFAASANAALIKGNVYDFSLNKADNVVVEVDSSPKQTFVAKNGEYAFTLEPGTYTLTATQKSGIDVVASVEEKVDIKTQGDFSVDLILFPVLEQDTIYEPAASDAGGQKDLLFVYVAAAMILFIIIGLAIRFFNTIKAKKTAGLSKKIPKSKKTETKNSVKETDAVDAYDSSQIITILKKHGGRATQKDIRKEIPLSEAKISLMIAELESKGKVKKIKKGRGNIIILE